MKFFQFSVMFLLFSQLFPCKQYFAKQKTNNEQNYKSKTNSQAHETNIEMSL